jgi:hypothetical protein
MATKTIAKKSTASKSTAKALPEFKSATAAMYNLLKGGKSITHAAVEAFKKKHKLRSAYQILFRLRRIGLRYKAFTIVPSDGVRSERSFKLVKGVKGAEAHWPKANPTRTAKPKSAKKKVAAKKADAKKPTQKKVVVKKGNVKKAVNKSTAQQIAKAKVAKAVKAAPTPAETLLAQLKAAAAE